MGERASKQANVCMHTYFCRTFGYIFSYFVSVFFRFKCSQHTLLHTHVVRRHITFSFLALFLSLSPSSSSSSSYYYYYFIYNFFLFGLLAHSFVRSFICLLVVLFSCYTYFLFTSHSCNVV